MADRYLIFGNSGAGKSTLARTLVEHSGGEHIDLDLYAWKPTSPPERRDLSESLAELQPLLERSPGWVIEGCYADLLTEFTCQAEVLIFLNPGVESCVRHCQKRPWEPHKYASKKEQDRNLGPLLAWVRGYTSRQGPMSERAHRALFDGFRGEKIELCTLPYAFDLIPSGTAK